MISTSLAIDDRPSAFRYPRGDGVGVEIPELAAPLEIGKGRIVNPATGKSVNVDLLPLSGPASAGSQVSLPALTTRPWTTAA